MKSFDRTIIIKSKVKRIVCNFCGNEIKKNDFGYFEEHLSVKKEWGFSSPYDGETHTFEICLHCYENLKKQMIIKP